MKRLGLFFSKRKIYHPPAQHPKNYFLVSACVCISFEKKGHLIFYFYYFTNFISRPPNSPFLKTSRSTGSRARLALSPRLKRQSTIWYLNCYVDSFIFWVESCREQSERRNKVQYIQEMSVSGWWPLLLGRLVEQMQNHQPPSSSDHQPTNAAAATNDRTATTTNDRTAPPPTTEEQQPGD